MITIVSPGPQSLIQDLGRPGFRHLGVSWSGAFDTRSAAQANLLVGNSPDAALIEVLLGGLVFETESDLWIALAGAPAPATITGRSSIPGGTPTSSAEATAEGAERGPTIPSASAPFDQRFRLPAASRLELGTPATGMRTYVAFAGGIDASPKLGSRSRDTLGELGPEPLAPSQTLALGAPPMGPAGQEQSRAADQSTPAAPATFKSEDAGNFEPGTTDLASADLAAALAASETSRRDLPVLQATATAHANLIAGDLAGLLAASPWTVGDRSSRIGIRLSGNPIPIEYPKSWASEPTLPGSIQLAPNGELIIFGPDGPTTGGYPVVAVAQEGALELLSQLRPGSQLKIMINA